jgi:hypothetical protein
VVGDGRLGANMGDLRGPDTGSNVLAVFGVEGSVLSADNGKSATSNSCGAGVIGIFGT